MMLLERLVFKHIGQVSSCVMVKQTEQRVILVGSSQKKAAPMSVATCGSCCISQKTILDAVRFPILGNLDNWAMAC